MARLDSATGKRAAGFAIEPCEGEIRQHHGDTSADVILTFTGEAYQRCLHDSFASPGIVPLRLITLCRVVDFDGSVLHAMCIQQSKYAGT